jgi:hypothetical protein
MAKSLMLGILMLFVSQLVSQKNAAYYYELGEKYRLQHKLNKAYKNYYKAAELGLNQHYYVKAAEAYYLCHDLKKVETIKKTNDIYNKSIWAKRWNSEILTSRAGFLKYLSNGKDALVDLDTVLKYDPKYLDAIFLKAEILMSNRDTSKAFSLYNSSVGLFSDTIHKIAIYNHKGGMCYIKKYWKEAVVAFEKAINIGGEDKFYHSCWLSSAYQGIGNQDSACYWYKKCNTQRYPNIYFKEEIVKKCK